MALPLQDALIAPHFLSSERRETVGDSERQLLGVLRRHGPSSQAQLCTQLGLSQQSVSRMGASLGARGMITRSIGAPTGQRGQPSSLLHLATEFAYSFGLSLMADGFSLVLSDFAGNRVARRSLSLQSLSRDEVLGAVQFAMAEMQDACAIATERVFGLGIAVSGFRVGGEARFNTPPSLAAFSLVDIEDIFANAFRLPVWAENDGKAATLAENLNGVGREISTFAYMFIATGIGGGVVVDGRPLTGVRGNAGEYSAIVPLDQFATRPTMESLRLFLNARGADIGSVQELAVTYSDDWDGIDAWLDEVSPTMSLIASATAAVLDTQAIVLGGLIPPALAKRLIEKIEFYDIRRGGVERERANVIFAKCCDDPAATGAALLPFVAKFFTL